MAGWTYTNILSINIFYILYVSVEYRRYIVHGNACGMWACWAPGRFLLGVHVPVNRAGEGGVVDRKMSQRNVTINTVNNDQWYKRK